MTYDHWKTTNPADEFLGPEPEDEGEPEPSEAVYLLSEAFRRINALGGLDSDNPFNRGIDAALDILVELGAKPDFTRTK